MNKTGSLKRPLLLIAIITVIAVSVTATVAFILTGTGSIVNTFSPAEVACEVSESFDGTEKEDVKIQNTGDVDACIRAKIVATWVKTDGSGNVVSVSGIKPVAGEDYVLDSGDFTSGKWTSVTSGSEATYYFTTVVPPGGYTANLVDSITVSSTADVPEGYRLSVDILAEAIQAEPLAAVADAWGVSADLFSKGGT